MGDGLNRARAAAKATRKGKCPVCGRTVTLRTVSGKVPVHGPRNARCAGSGQSPARGA
jgi:hypothetical protein